MKKDIIYQIFNLGSQLGLNKNEIKNIIHKQESIKDQISFSSGPPFYPGGRYGTISIKEFQ